MHPVRPAARRLVLACGFVLSALAAVTATAAVETPLAVAARQQQSVYREQQFARLAQLDTRDARLAAVLLALPGDPDVAALPALADAERRLAAHDAADPLAAYVLALSCQVERPRCSHPEHYTALVERAPDNAVHWLLLPDGAAPSDTQLHSAAVAPRADSHLRELVTLMRGALAGQPAPAVAAGVDAGELAGTLRRATVDAVPLLHYAPVVKLCRGATGPRRDDCLALGHKFVADASGTLLSRMIGSVMLRRLLPGTTEDAAAKIVRRDYVWLSDQFEARDLLHSDALQAAIPAAGEWAAWQQAAKANGIATTPPADWKAQQPQALLLPEERTPNVAK